jgi:hypothetical protein
MKKFASLLFLAAFAITSPLYAKDKDSSLEGVIKDSINEGDHPGKGKGRPDNPGEHGRENAADKQSRGHGNGSKKEESWEDRVRDDIEGEDKDDKKAKGKDKDKDKGKNKNKKK